jgi:ELWxxDGT repeat protein
MLKTGPIQSSAARMSSIVTLIGDPYLVKDINPGRIDQPDRGSSGIFDMIAFTDSLLFGANDGVHGMELWKSNSRHGVTEMVTDLETGPRSSLAVPGFVVLRNELYFAAAVNYKGGLWKTNGTARGTSSFSSVYPNFLGKGDMIGFDDVLYYADDSLWKLDGTGNGLFKLKGNYMSASSPIAVSNHIYFFATGPSPLYEQGLWKSDGTEAGTVLVKGGISIDGIDVRSSFTEAVGNILFFSAIDLSDRIKGRQLWRSDGTAKGTTRITDILGPNYGGAPTNPGLGINPKYLTAVGNLLYFVAQDQAHGLELWRSDGTINGTHILKDIEPGPGSSAPANLTTVGNSLFFSAGPDNRLWRTEGTPESTVAVVTDTYSQPKLYNIQAIELVEQTLFLAATGTGDATIYGQELYAQQLKFPPSKIINGIMIHGSKQRDELSGLTGDDTIYGLGGNDLLRGGRDDDLLYGHGGDDLLIGGLGSDTLMGNSGKDTLIGSEGKDFLIGSTGIDEYQFEFYSDSKLDSRYRDRIIRLEIGKDVARGVNPLARFYPILHLGSVNKLAKKQVERLLNPSVLTSHATATFLFTTAAGATQTFLAMNDSIAGLQAANDLVVEITGYSGNLQNLSII